MVTTRTTARAGGSLQGALGSSLAIWSGFRSNLATLVSTSIPSTRLPRIPRDTLWRSRASRPADFRTIKHILTEYIARGTYSSRQGRVSHRRISCVLRREGALEHDFDCVITSREAFRLRQEVAFRLADALSYVRRRLTAVSTGRVRTALGFSSFTYKSLKSRECPRPRRLWLVSIGERSRAILDSMLRFHADSRFVVNRAAA